MRIVFIGTGAIGVPTSEMLRESLEHELVGVVTQPDRPAGRNQQIAAPPVKAAMAQSSEARPVERAGKAIPILQPTRLKSEEAVTQIRVLTPDLIVVMAYGQILPRAVLDIPRLGCLNLHASLLPRWRGAAPIQAAIAEGDRETGITVMQMDEGLDTGDILLQRTIEIAPDETGGSLHDQLARLAPEALKDALSLLENGEAPRIPQNNSLATYAPKLEREHGRIDWNEPAEVIERKIRAFNPWPGAFTRIRDEHHGECNLKIFRARIVPAGHMGLKFKAAVGQIAPLDVQLEGSRRMSAEELMRGHRILKAG